MAEGVNLRYTLVPNGLWQCGDCGALVIQTSLHDDFHAGLDGHQHQVTTNAVDYTDGTHKQGTTTCPHPFKETP